MNNYFRIVYVNTRAAGEVSDYPDDVKNIRDWSWGQSAAVRWFFIQPNELPSFLTRADLFVLDWSSKNSKDAEDICGQIRTVCPDLPILIVESYQGQTPTRDAFVSSDANACVAADLTDSVEVARGFATLKVALPTVSIRIHPVPNDLATIRLLEWVGEERLPLMIQKYFPEAKNAYILPVGGGWSDAKLCRLFVDKDDSEYFVKFFTRRDVYTDELVRHAEAKTWLRDSTVDLKVVPDIDGDISNQNQAFPDLSPPRYPACYESASKRDHHRETYKEIYLTHTNDFVQGVLDRLLEILATGQPNIQGSQPPWSDSDTGLFYLTSDIKASVIDTINDLAMYGPAACSGAKWSESCKAIQEVIYKPPKWLYEPWPVLTGHVHGDPNPRNCLVNPTDSSDLQLIDCGGYSSNGRLVSDLALIERDVKLVLMRIEGSAGGFFDLEVGELPNWCHTETDAISRKLNYSRALAPASSDSLGRAYSLIGRIRERAKELSSCDDHGRHYFAALLYWTLDILKYPAVRPTKKLLAIYSAGEIIRSMP